MGIAKRGKKRSKRKHRKMYHVTFSKVKRCWFVRPGGSLSPFRKQSSAFRHARALAKKNKPSEVCIHAKNGKIRAKHSYGFDPRKIKG